MNDVAIQTYVLYLSHHSVTVADCHIRQHRVRLQVSVADEREAAACGEGRGAGDAGGAKRDKVWAAERGVEG